MKTITALTFSLLALLPVKMLADGSATLNGALIGGVAGAIIGNNSGGHNGGLRGAVIGSAAGALIGSAVDDSRGYHGYSGRSNVSVSYGFGYGYSPYYGHDHPGYRYSRFGWGYPSFYYSYSRPVYYSDYEDARPVQVVTAPETPVTTASATTTQSTPQNVTIINNYYGNSAPMSSANSMFGR